MFAKKSRFLFDFQKMTFKIISKRFLKNLLIILDIPKSKTIHIITFTLSLFRKFI